MASLLRHLVYSARNPHILISRVDNQDFQTRLTEPMSQPYPSFQAQGYHSQASDTRGSAFKYSDHINMRAEITDPLWAEHHSEQPNQPPDWDHHGPQPGNPAPGCDESFMQSTTTVLDYQDFEYAQESDLLHTNPQYPDASPPNAGVDWYSHFPFHHQANRMMTPWASAGGLDDFPQGTAISESSTFGTWTSDPNIQGFDLWSNPHSTDPLTSSQASTLSSQPLDNTGIPFDLGAWLDLPQIDDFPDDGHLSPRWRPARMNADLAMVSEQHQGRGTEISQRHAMRNQGAEGSDNPLARESPKLPLNQTQDVAVPDCHAFTGQGRKRHPSPTSTSTKSNNNRPKRHKRKYTAEEKERINWKRKNGVCEDCRNAKRRVCPLFRQISIPPETDTGRDSAIMSILPIQRPLVHIRRTCPLEPLKDPLRSLLLRRMRCRPWLREQYGSGY